MLVVLVGGDSEPTTDDFVDRVTSAAESVHGDGRVSDVQCPTDAPTHEGSVFTCSFIADGQREEATIEIRDDGKFTVGVRVPRPTF